MKKLLCISLLFAAVILKSAQQNQPQYKASVFNATDIIISSFNFYKLRVLFELDKDCTVYLPSRDWHSIDYDPKAKSNKYTFEYNGASFDVELNAHKKFIEKNPEFVLVLEQELGKGLKAKLLSQKHFEEILRPQKIKEKIKECQICPEGVGGIIAGYASYAGE